MHAVCGKTPQRYRSLHAIWHYTELGLGLYLPPGRCSISCPYPSHNRPVLDLSGGGDWKCGSGKYMSDNVGLRINRNVC